MKSFLLVLMTCLVTAPALAQQDRNTPRPIAALDTVWIEEMTWMEVRDAIKGGKTTVIVAAGTVEQNGPYVANGKHNYNERADAEAIARRLGNALVAPILPIGASDTPPESDNGTLYPGTFAIRSDVFKMMVTDVCASLKRHGFKDIILISDNGGNDVPLKQVGEALRTAWAGQPTRVHYLPEYPAKDLMDKTLPAMGIVEKSEGIHDEYRVTALLMMVNPEYVRLKQRIAAGKATINGVSIVPAEKTIANAKKLFDIKIAATVDAIKKVVAQEKATR